MPKGTVPDRSAAEEAKKLFLADKEDTDSDLNRRVSGVPCVGGGGGYQLAGYRRLEMFYRGDQWNAPEPPGASQRTDNYCAMVVDTMGSLPFDDDPDVSCPTDDPSDALLEARAEAREALLARVYQDNRSSVEFDELAKCCSLFGDGFIKGPYLVDDPLGGRRIGFHHIEDPSTVRPVWKDGRFKEISSFLEEFGLSVREAEERYSKAANEHGLDIRKFAAMAEPSTGIRSTDPTRQPMVKLFERWDGKTRSVHLPGGQTLDHEVHNWNFVPLDHVKNTYIPRWPFGKSDLEDVLDPQLSHNRAMNDLHNFLRWISTVNLWGKNIDGLEMIVAGLSRVYSLPDDGEIHAFEKPGDPYIASTFVAQRKSSLVELSGLNDAMMSSSQLSVASGRALAVAFQGTLRRLNPRMKRFEQTLESLNAKILRLAEKNIPSAKEIIDGDYRTRVKLHSTLTRNVVDTINKLQTGIISLDTAQKECGVARPKMEQKVMKNNLADPVLGPQIARQPGFLAQLQEFENGPGEGPMPGPGRQFSSPEGRPNAVNQQASGAAPTPSR